ncbi:MAG: CRISPR-associated endonuclease Cas2, partial [Acidimicrobiales bacterium]
MDSAYSASHAPSTPFARRPRRIPVICAGRLEVDLVVTYDINTATVDGQRRLARVAAICERYGQRAQYSVFECRLNEVRFARLVGELSGALELSKDSVYLYRLQGGIEQCRTSLGRPSAHALG